MLARAPNEGCDTYDRINACSLEITRGPLVVAGCTDYSAEAARIATAPDMHRVRISYRFCGDERYLIRLWQAVQIVVKARTA